MFSRNINSKTQKRANSNKLKPPVGFILVGKGFHRLTENPLGKATLTDRKLKRPSDENQELVVQLNKASFRTPPSSNRNEGTNFTCPRNGGLRPEPSFSPPTRGSLRSRPATVSPTSLCLRSSCRMCACCLREGAGLALSFVPRHRALVVAGRLGKTIICSFIIIFNQTYFLYNSFLVSKLENKPELKTVKRLHS
jgi:hypothetical protein